jgi:hypothetical protein
VHRRAQRVGAMAPSDKDAYAEFREGKGTQVRYQPFSPLIYSVENCTPLVKLGQDERWQPDPDPHLCVPPVAAGKLLGNHSQGAGVASLDHDWVGVVAGVILRRRFDWHNQDQLSGQKMCSETGVVALLLGESLGCWRTFATPRLICRTLRGVSDRCAPRNDSSRDSDFYTSHRTLLTCLPVVNPRRFRLRP